MPDVDLDAHFKEINIPDVNAALAHAFETSQKISDISRINSAKISAQIKNRPKRPPIERPERELTPIDLAIIELAPNHLQKGKYNLITLAQALHEKGLSPKNYESNPLIFRDLVGNYISKLKRTRKIYWPTRKISVKLRDATEAEISKHKGLIGLALKSGPFTPKNWRSYINSKEANTVAMRGLVHAIERFDSSAGLQFSSYAVPIISGYVSMAVRELKGKKWYATRSLQAPVSGSDNLTLEDTKAASQPSFEDLTRDSKIHSLFKLQQKGRVRKADYLIWLLTKMGHTPTEIARYLGSYKQRIQGRLKIVKRHEERLDRLDV